MTSIVLDVQKVSKSFKQGSTDILVLRDVSFSLERGTTTAIVGKSGSGKSTLLSLIAGLDVPESGHIKILGSDLSRMDEAQLTRFRGSQVGIVFQQFHLLPNLTALENVCLPLEIQGEKDIENRALEALSQVGLSSRVKHFPHQLSGGEKQRVAIARAIIHNPDVLLADEPSGNLDNETGEVVMKVLFDLMEQRSMSMVLVTHSLEFASHCNHVLTLNKGVLQNDASIDPH